MDASEHGARDATVRHADEVGNTANADQYEAWNGVSGRRWVVDPDRRDRIIASVGDALFDAADLVAGERVVDIGCGCGATTLAAARAVAPGGEVVGVDLSAPMLDVAQHRSRAVGSANVAFEQADAQTHALGDARFDVALSRFGTMFFDDPVAAFATIASALRPGGRLCIATWQPLDANEWLAVPGAVLLSYGSRPEASDGPGMFAQSDPAIIASTLVDAGLTAVDVAPAAVTLTLGADPADAAEQLAGIGPCRSVWETIPDADRPAALDAVRAMLADHASASGVQLDAAIWITTARRPAALP